MTALNMQTINKQIFTDGNIIVSPQKLVALNNKPPELLKAPYNSTVTNTGYSVYLSGYAQHILRTESAFPKY